MARSDSGDTKRPIERLANFSDAVIAIAITLLVLPLVDKVSDSGTLSPQVLIDEYSVQLVLFAISFLVIAKFWLVHHSIFQPLKWFNGRIFALDVVWLLSIVIIPFTTELISGDKNGGQLSVALYIGTLFVTALVGLLMQYEVARRPELRFEDAKIPSLVGGFSTLLLIGVALIIAIVFPAIGMWAMLLLVLSGPLTIILRKQYS